MIIPADLAKLILQGKKTMACFSATKPKCFYRPGHDYSLQAGGWFELPPKTLKERITVEAVRRCRTDEIDLRDAKRLGFRSRADFFERWDGSDDVWLVSFVLGVHTDQPRLLARRCGSSSGDYVSSPSQALPNTAEEVSEGVQKRFALEGQANLALNRSVPRERLVEAVEAMRAQAGNAKHRRRWRSIEHQLSMMDREAS